MRTRSVLSALAAPVLATGLCAALASPAQAAADGTYLVKDVVTGECLAGTALAPCGSSGTAWTLRGHGDGTVQFIETAATGPGAATATGTIGPMGQAGSAGSAETRFSMTTETGRCLALPQTLTYPAALHLDTCGSMSDLSDRWRIEGWDDGPVTIAHAYSPTGRLAIKGQAVHVSNNSSAVWTLQALDADD